MSKTENPGAEIIEFPKDRIKRPPLLEPEEAVEKLSTEYVQHIRDLSMLMSNSVVEKLVSIGHKIDERTIRDMCLVTESIFSLVCKERGITHPLQILASHSFDEVDNGGYIFNPKMNHDNSRPE